MRLSGIITALVLLSPVLAYPASNAEPATPEDKDLSKRLCANCHYACAAACVLSGGATPFGSGCNVSFLSEFHLKTILMRTSLLEAVLHFSYAVG
jgi:hypothetical protein